MITCDQCRNELAEHALGHLSVENRATVDEHLAACPVCRHEAAAIVATWSALPMTLEPVAPPADLFDRIASRIDDAPQAWKQRSSRHVVENAPGAKQGRSDSPRRLTTGQRMLSYAVAASIFFGLTATFAKLMLPSGEHARIEQIAQEIRDSESERLARFNSQPLRLLPVHAPPAAEAYIIWDLPSHEWQFHAVGLPPAPTGQTYQLWAANEQGDHFAGPRFNVNAQGVASAIGYFPKISPDDAPRAIVTLEPDAQADRPSGEPIFAAPL